MNDLSLCVGAENAYSAITLMLQEATHLFESYIEKKYADPVKKAFIEVRDGSLASETSVSEISRGDEAEVTGEMEAREGPPEEDIPATTNSGITGDNQQASSGFLLKLRHRRSAKTAK